MARFLVVHFLVPKAGWIRRRLDSSLVGTERKQPQGPNERLEFFRFYAQKSTFPSASSIWFALSLKIRL